MNSPFLLRVAGLPVESVRALRCPESRRWADEVLAAAEESAAEGRAVGDLLHGLVGGCADERVRRALLALRREVFNGRLPRDADAARTLVGGLDRDAGRALDAWLTRGKAIEARRAEGAALVEAETARARAALVRLAGDERLRGGLLLASPSLDAQLDAYVEKAAASGPGRRPDKKHRKIERSLMSYLYRTACKTSPFATFTGVALGEFGEGGGLLTALDDPWTSHVRLNVAVIGRLAEAVAADRDRRTDLPVTPASGWGRDDDRVRYVRRWVTTGDDDTAVTFDAVQDRLFFLRRSGTLERLLSLFEERGAADGRGPLRHGELAAWLAADRGAGADEAERYLGALLDIGMVQIPCLRTEVHDTDPLGAFRAALGAVGRPWADALADRLAGAADRLERYPAAGPAERRRLVAELRTELADVQKELGVERPRVPRTVLYEDAAAPLADGPGMGRDAWAELAEGPLGSVERLLPAFDLTLPQRITFKGFFTTRYGRGGRCDDLLKLVHDFHEDFFDQYLSFTRTRTAFDAEGEYVPEENWLGLPQLKSLDTARRTFVERMRALYAQGGAGADELVVDDAFVDDVAGELDGVAPHFAPMSHHVQLAGRPSGDPLVVLNRSYGGISFPYSRFTHCFDGVEERLLAGNAARVPAGAVLAEVTGGPVTSNLNLHGRLTEYEIVCPGESGTLAPERQLDLADLYIEHDEADDRLVLRSARLGREVVPVYLGYLVPLALPELPRTLLLLSPTSMSPLNVWGGVPEGAPEGGVTRRPRVSHRGVVLARRSWSAPAAVLPLRTPELTDAEWFLGWHRFRRAHGLPCRVYATVSDSGARGATGAKPQYLDFDSPLSLAAFESLLVTERARVVLREALPDEDGLHTVSARGHHVAELAVETAASVRVRARQGSAA
ncbi:lantibiotic dehydratase [Streptomyces sp. NPDC050504]|uniref:lantibiotic dehydratase n=1 Tax=Streptomyces sp. NPDC050504 TaxID=3365618 RepID=UPI0037A62E5B